MRDPCTSALLLLRSPFLRDFSPGAHQIRAYTGFTPGSYRSAVPHRVSIDLIDYSLIGWLCGGLCDVTMRSIKHSIRCFKNGERSQGVLLSPI